MNAARPGPGPANEASLAVSPSVLAEAALISHEGRCQLIFCLEPRKLNNPLKMQPSPFPLYLLTKIPPHSLPLRLNRKDAALSRCSCDVWRGNKRRCDGHMHRPALRWPRTGRSRQEGFCLVNSVYLTVYKGKEMNSESYTFCPEIRLAHLSLTQLIRPNLHSQMRLIKMDLPFSL